MEEDVYNLQQRPDIVINDALVINSNDTKLIEDNFKILCD
ncbi:unnamed protein product [marine sediment metagenome]|uniref:Uncharacterized protein n=1 Tax=marine sediment metagenome TaxID=412755 RepID=X0S191_9ZZZZ